MAFFIDENDVIIAGKSSRTVFFLLLTALFRAPRLSAELPCCPAQRVVQLPPLSKPFTA
jgi:hypothetical protein